MGIDRVVCDLCGADDCKVLFEGKDRIHHIPGSFPVVQCQRCQLVYLNPRPDETSLSQYYPEDYSPFTTSHGLTGTLQLWFRKREAARIGRMLSNRGRVLEIGCAAGDLLLPLRDQAGLEVAGIEMSDYAASWAREKHNLNVHTGTIFDAPYPKTYFNGIVMRHVIEHLPSPRDALRQAATLLQKGGILLVSTPNFDGIDRRVFGQFWHDFETPRHLIIFSVATLKNLLTMTGFKVINVSHSLLPNDWVHSVRYVLENLFGPLPIFRAFSIKNPFFLLMFLPMSFLQKILRKSGRIEITAIKVK